MNFFDYQDRARKWTRLLVVLYALAVVSIVLAVNLFVAAVLGIYLSGDSSAAINESMRTVHVGDVVLRWNAAQLAMIALLVLVLILGGTLWKIAQLAGGGEIVARMMGGSSLSSDATDACERQLRNVVEEMAIASGVPVPQIFLLRDEREINAFAAGHTTNDAAIVVTNGALRYLNRDELQGVIGHEFSHILNGDMRLNIRLTGMLHGLLVIALTGYGLIRLLFPISISSDDDDGGSSRKRGGAGGSIGILLCVLGMGLMFIGYIGVFFANLIKAAIGREREYLADASAVQFTRNPAGLAGALKKIGAREFGGRVEAADAAQTSHFFIADPGVHSWLCFLDTHPPLNERIRRLDPAFTGDFGALRQQLQAEMEKDYLPLRDRTFGPPPVSHGAAAVVAVGNLADHVGSADFQDVAYAAALLDAIPAECRSAAGTIAGAETVLYALVLSRQPVLRQKQMALLASRSPANVYARMVFFADRCGAMPEASRLPLADLAISGLRGMDANAYTAFRESLMAMVQAEEEVDVFEFTLMHMVARRLDRQFGLARAPRIRYQDFDGLGDAIACVFSLLVWNGTTDDVAAQTAFAAGWVALGETRTENLRGRNDDRLRDLEEHLDSLAELAPQLKARLLSACAAIAAADGHTTLREAETLRAVADALDCPVPPFAPEAEVAVA